MDFNLKRFWEVAEQKAKPEANFVLFATMRFAVDLINSRRKFFRYDLCWNKNNKCGFLWANHQPLRSHESILIFIRPGFFKKATYNALRTPGGRAAQRRISRASNGVYGATNSYISVCDGLLHPSSVLCFDSDRGNNNAKIHPTQKPLALMQWLVSAYTNPGDTVIDPFAGSGTTALACLTLGRKCIAIEREQKYFDIACQRVEQAYHGADANDGQPYFPIHSGYDTKQNYRRGFGFNVPRIDYSQLTGHY